jgi:hypothetical protein
MSLTGAGHGSPAYAGIGARETPPAALALIEAIAGRLAREGWLLRTGMSPGADQAFYRGALAGGGHVELYLPWPGFQAAARVGEQGAAVSQLPRPSSAAIALAARFHERWDGLPCAERRLLARDGHQVLGAELDAPVRCIVCWTAEGSLDGADPRSGGSGQALRIAHERGIPVFNLVREDHARRILGRGPGASG